MSVPAVKLSNGESIPILGIGTWKVRVESLHYDLTYRKKNSLIRDPVRKYKFSQISKFIC